MRIISLIMIITLFSGCVSEKMTIPYEPNKTFEYSKEIKINYERCGDEGPAVIFLHGFGASIATWNDIRNNLPKNHQYYFIDLKGFGHSSKPRDDKYSFEDHSQIITSFINKNNLSNVTLIGHSYGGGVALFTYINFCDKPNNPIKKLVLIDSAGKTLDYPFFIDWLRAPIINTIFLRLTSGKYRAKYTLNKLFFDKIKVTEERILRYAYFYRMKETHYTFIETAKQILPDNYDEIAKKIMEIKVPTLIIWGKNDPIFPVDDAYSFEKDIASSKAYIIDNCGHIPNEEKPEQTANLIKEFLQKYE